MLALLLASTAWIRFVGGPHCVASLGDVDGDGRADVVIACSFGGKQVGRAALVSGRTGGVLHAWEGESKDHEFGRSVAACGDVDGDGRCDVAIAAPGIGHVDVFSSRTGERVRRLLPPRPNVRFGEEIANAGDVDGDGKVDLVVGAPGSNRAYVFSGKDGKLLLALDNGPAAGSFGRAVAGGGDLDRDGRADIVVGAPGEEGSGRVHAFSGRDGRPLWLDASLRCAARSDAGLGISVAMLQDLDGDGRVELLVGADGVERHGEAYVLNGRDGSRRWTIPATDRMFARFGASVATIGDVDGDGVRELAIGDPDDSDSMSDPPEDMSRGHAPGSVHVVSGRTGLRLWMAFGDEQHDCLGFCVASAGDVDGDGRDDVLAMATNGIAWSRNEPYFRVYSGKDGQLVRELHLPPAKASAAPHAGPR